MREAYELPTFLGRTVPVEFAARLTGFEVEGSGGVLRCAAGRYEPEVVSRRKEARAGRGGA